MKEIASYVESGSSRIGAVRLKADATGRFQEAERSSVRTLEELRAAAFTIRCRADSAVDR
jgi:hypothetical protein